MVITLPIKAIREIGDDYVKIDVSKTELSQIQIDWKALKRYYGSLKNAYPSPLEYQQERRAEWDDR